MGHLSPPHAEFAWWVRHAGTPRSRRACDDSERISRTSDKDTGPQAAAKSVAEDVKGKVKEAAGALAGQDELKREGEAQQAKASAQRDIAAKEGEAEKARAEAKVHEEQRSHQD